MKVLFAVKSESISDAIIRRYQKEYREILSYKNVYYFNAILKEIQQDKSYDRIVISEDLEPFSNNNYDIIDKFIFEKLDNISDEAQNSEGKDTSIIFICTERHSKGSSFLVKLFGIGIYNALLGTDRGMEQVCKLINQPRLKKEAKMYYKIDSEDVNYDPSSGKEVSETEIQNILYHFKRYAKEKEKYAESFNNIATQYTEEQLKIIVNCLPISVKTVLQEECQTYQAFMAANSIPRINTSSINAGNLSQQKSGIKIDILENKLSQPKMSGPIVIPSSVKKSGAKNPIKVNKVTEKIEESSERKVVKKATPLIQNVPVEKEEVNFDDMLADIDDVDINEDFMFDTFEEENNQGATTNEVESIIEEDDFLSTLEDEEDTEIDDITTLEEDDIVEENKTITIKKGRGRPRKNPAEVVEKTKGKRGRPRKNNVEAEEIEDDELLMDFDNSEEEEEDDDELITTLDYENEEDLLSTLDEEDEILSTLDEEDDDEELISTLETDNDEDDFLSTLEDEDEVTLSISETEEEEDELLTTFETDDDILNSQLDELDDIEDVEDNQEESDDDDFLSAMDYEDFGEDDYLVSKMEEQDDDDSLIMTLGDEDDFEEPEVKKESKNIKSVKTVITPQASKVEKEELIEEEPILNETNIEFSNDYSQENRVESIKPQVNYSMSNLNSLLTKEKKIATFVGATKNGTSFLVNHLAILFSSIMGINTAILDMTKNRNSYYIYTKNEEELRKVAYTSIEKLENGFAEGIKVNKNLTVYTDLPNNGKEYTNAEAILSTLAQNHSIVLIDCDFETDPSYFANCQEIYLVQSMDILTIQPLTSFLRELKAKGVLESEKVRVVINKELKVRSLTTKMIIGGMSFYNDPAMAFMTELFNKDMVKACSIPFEISTYAKYLDSMVNCEVTINGINKDFLNKLQVLADMVYPLSGSKQTYGKIPTNFNKKNNMNDSLNQMKNKF